ncbi:phosphoglycolate phosphatase [Afifella sp. JA880]|uniref:phosphoglycolate phosphatase n=1 Tax=Afifella sp. JA880 TaxID=2975280 RepID=UPI0021BB1109|nr:phosphoglycolate phosphatase [Afifella sp. JA880]MCT8266633.1 phosphoglycolate phosphatase [Afifella sp. JA880]
MASSWPKAIIFDLDGTLVDSVPDLTDALNDLLVEEGLPAVNEDNVRKMVGDGVEKLVERGFEARGRTLDKVELEGLVARFLALYEPRATEKTVLFPTAVETLAGLEESGIALAVVTNKPGAATRLILEGLGVAERFGAVIGGDSGLPKKPEPAVLLAALQQLGISAEDALMVGDSPADVGAARSAGLPVLVMSYGYTKLPPEELGADQVIDSLSEIVEAIRMMRTAA